MLLSIASVSISTLRPVSAATGINHQINFQGKLVNTDGTNVTDGTYSIVFSLYTVSSGGSNIWTETQGSVALSNGIFQVNLGSVTTLPGSVDFNTDNLYLGIKVGADAEMTPRVQFTAVPQAFNSEKLGGLDKTGFIQNQTGVTQTADFKISGTGNIGTSLTTPLLQAAAATALTITGNAASTWSTSAGTLTIQGGSGTVSLGTSTNLTSTGALTITGGTTLSVDSTGTNALNLGTSANAHTVTLGSTTSTSNTIIQAGSTGINLNAGTIVGNVTSQSLFNTIATTMNFAGAATTVTIGATTGTTTIGNNLVLNTGNYISLPGSGTRPGSPTAGMLYYDTSTNSLLQYNGTKWVSDHHVYTKIVAASNASQSLKDAADYIATGTGDESTINTALTAASGGAVYLTEGTYNLTAAISIPNNTTLAGAGAGTLITIPNAQNGTYNMIQNTDTSTGTHVVIRDLQIDGNKANQTSGNMIGIKFTGMGGGTGATARDGGRITGVIIRNVYGSASGTGLNLTNSDNNTISGNSIVAPSTYAVNLSGADNNTFTGNTLQGSNTYGFYLGSSDTNNTFSGNFMQGFTYGLVTLSGSTYNTITGNTAQGNTSTGFLLDTAFNTLTGNTSQGNPTGIGLNSGGSYNTVSGNTINTTAATGISIFASSFNNVSGNKIYDSGGATTNVAFSITSSSLSNSIMNNDIADSSCTTSCVWMTIDASSTGTYLSGNRHAGSAANADTITDSAPNTAYVNQADSSGNLINKSAGGGLTIGASAATASLTLQGGLVSTQLSAPTLSATVTNVGTAGATTYRYQITATDGTGETTGSTIQQTTTGNATLSGANYNTITWTQVGGAVSYKIYRCTGAACTPALLTTVTGSNVSYNDQANGAPSGAVPGSNTTGGASIAGLLQSASLNVTGTAQFSALTSNGVLHTSGGNGTLAVSAVLLGSEVSGTLAATNGGTGQNTYAVGDLLVGDTSNTLSKIAAVASGSCLISQGVTTKPVWGACGAANVSSLNTFTGALSILGTANQITVTNSTPNITLSLPQNIDTAATVTFGKLTVGNSTTGLVLSGTPVPGTGITSLLQLGSAIAGGNSAANGGTYLGLNAPNAGAGSAADFLNFQKNGSTKLKVDNTGMLSATGGLVVGDFTSGSGNFIDITQGAGGASNKIRLTSAGIAGGDATLFLPPINGATVCVDSNNCNYIGSIGAYSTTNTAANGATLSSGSIIFQNASATAPGMVGTGAQTFAGAKTIIANSTAAFQVQNASSTPIFLVDTSTTSNLITNPGFEVNTSTGWTYTNATGTQNLTKSNTFHGQASNSVNITVANGSANITGFTAAITPAQYTFSFYAMKGTNAGTLSVAITGGSAPACTLINYIAPVTTGFNRYICTFTSTTTNVTQISIKSNNTGTFYLDGVELNTGASAAPYAAQGAVQIRGTINNPLTIQNTADSTSAFQIQNSAGNSNLFVADTLNSSISIGGQLTVTGLNNTISGNLFINGAGSLSVTTGNAIFSYTPSASATSSLVQIGNAIAGGNAVANGGTYLGLNAPAAGAGSAADFLNFQLNGTQKLKVDNTGLITTAGGLAVGASTVITSGGVLQNVTANASIITAGSLAATVGGTGQSSYAIGDLLYAATTTTLGKLAAVASGSCLISQGVSTAPIWGACGNGNIAQAPISTAQNTIQPATTAVVGLTINGTNTGTAAQALIVNQNGSADAVNVNITGGTQTNGLSVTRTNAGTTTNLLNLTNTSGTVTTGINLLNSSGTVTTGISLAGVYTTGISLPSPNGSGLTGIKLGGVTTSAVGIDLGVVNNSAIGLQFTGGANTTGIKGTFAGGAGITGSYINLQQTTTASSTGTNTENLILLNRNQTISSGTLTESGNIIDVTNNCSGAGTCTDTSSLISLNQQYANASGAVLKIQSAGSGNLVQITDTTATARDVFTIANGGATVLRNQTDSTAALQVQSSASGTDVLTVDTTNSAVYLRGVNSAATAGSNIVTSQNFTTAAWTTCNGGAGGWSGTATTATHNTGNTVACSAAGSNFTVVSGSTYQVSYTLAGNTTDTNTVVASMGGLSAPAIGQTGTNTQSFTVTTTSTAALTFTPSTNFNGTISNISVKLVTLANSVLTVRNSDATAGLEVRAGGSNRSNTFVGISSGQNSDITSDNNTGFGAYTLQSNVAGYSNTAIGNTALQYNVNGAENTALGDGALKQNSNGSDNTALGYGVLFTNTTGTQNVGLGAYALSFATAASFNTGLGYQSLYTTTGSSNTGIGYRSGYTNTSGTFNTFLGLSADASAGNFVNATAVGAKAYVGASNSLVLGSINGVNGATSSTNVGIGTSAPAYTLEVVSAAGGRITVDDGAGRRLNLLGGTASQTPTISSYAGIDFSGNETNRHFGIGSTGDAVFQTSASSTTAFKILQNTTNASLLNADTTNMRISIGSIGTATSQLFVGGSIPTATLGSLGISAGPRDIVVNGRYAYVSFATSPYGIGIYDLSNPASPVLVGSVNVGNASSGVAVSGNYVYVTNFLGSSVSIFDVTNPASPTSVGTATVGAGPTDIVVAGRYVYVTNFSGNSMSIIDVSNPTAPLVVSTTATSTGPNGLAVQGKYVYVLTKTVNNLQIFDVSNPSVPVLMTAAGSYAGANSGVAVKVVGKYAYIVNTGANTLNIADISNPTTVTSVGNGAIGANSHAVVVNDRYAYVTSVNGNTIAVLDITNPASPSSLGTMPSSGGTYGMAIWGRYAYVTTSTGNTLQTFDLGGSYIQQLETGSIEAASVSVTGGLNVQGAITSQSSAAIGTNLSVGRDLSVYGNTNLGGATSSTVAATPAFVKQTTATSGSASKINHTVAVTSTTGNLLVATIGLASNTGTVVNTITDTAGNNWQLATRGYATASNSRIEIWYAANAQAVTSLTVGLSASSNFSVNVSEYSGVAATNPLDEYAGNSDGATSTTPTTPGITTAANNELVIAATNRDNNTTATATPAGYTALSAAIALTPNTSQNAAYLVKATAGATSASWTLSATADSGTAIVAFKAATSVTQLSRTNITGNVGINVATSDINSALTIAGNSANLNNPVAIIQGATGQVGNILQIQDANANQSLAVTGTGIVVAGAAKSQQIGTEGFESGSLANYNNVGVGVIDSVQKHSGANAFHINAAGSAANLRDFIPTTDSVDVTAYTYSASSATSGNPNIIEIGNDQNHTVVLSRTDANAGFSLWDRATATTLATTATTFPLSQWNKVELKVTIRGNVLTATAWLNDVQILTATENYTYSPYFYYFQLGDTGSVTTNMWWDDVSYSLSSTANGAFQVNGNTIMQAQAGQGGNLLDFLDSGGNSKAHIDQYGNATFTDFTVGDITVNPYGSGVAGLVVNAASGQTADLIAVKSNTAVPYFTVKGGGTVQVGSVTTDTTQINFTVDSFSTYADSGTCNATTNQGSLYYNTNTNSDALRLCEGGNGWTDVVAVKDLGLLAFGIVEASGANPGDVYSVTSTINGPCKAYVGASTTTVAWNACTVYSGGRKVVVTAGSTTTTNSVGGQFQHLCLTGANGQPALSTAGAETANLSTVSFPSASAPIVCLADVTFSGANNTITDIYDTRVFLGSEKQYATVEITAGVLGQLVKDSLTTPGGVQATTAANTGNLIGVIVATTGSASTTTVNAIIVTRGVVTVKAVTGSNGRHYIASSATTGYATTTTTPTINGTTTTTNQTILGISRGNNWAGATACAANTDNCRGSLVTTINIF